MYIYTLQNANLFAEQKFSVPVHTIHTHARSHMHNPAMLTEIHQMKF